jgi:glycosyltransferase involved in cell wall biosynthesis
MSSLPQYVVVTPARNEAEFIELTIQSVVKQTVLPMQWVIVSDGSTDATDDIVAKYASQYDWIKLLRASERQERHFAGKVHAFNAGLQFVKAMDYQAIASLDADLSFGPRYFELLLEKLSSDSQLGLVGTPFRDRGSNETYDYSFVNIEHVSGACQLFRRSCFESIGGYEPVKGGGIDYIAVVKSRMQGWKTRTFTEEVALHHRPIGTAQQGLLKAKFKYGSKDYVLGNHPLWECSRVLYQMTKKPYIMGGASLGAGFISAWLRRLDRPVNHDFVAFQRREQMQRLKRFLSRATAPVH